MCGRRRTSARRMLRGEGRIFAGGQSGEIEFAIRLKTDDNKYQCAGPRPTDSNNAGRDKRTPIMGSIVTIEASGLLGLPLDMRERHGLREGSQVVIEEEGDALVIRPLPLVVAEVQEMTREMLPVNSGASVDDFLADRRAEAKRE
jgi:bifunctional DNA-binding transcriptional regulator/antitoxin component of YhaV-PrlF toxin-antitoxin module